MNYDKLYSNGIPRYVKVYEVKKNPPMDRYTIIFTHLNWIGKEYIGKTAYIGSGKDPRGISYSELRDYGSVGGLGTRITWEELPEAVQKMADEYYRDLWG